MKLSKSQVPRFFTNWKNACAVQGWTAANGWTAAQIENERYSLLRRAGFDSLRDVDPLTGFDRVLAELALLLHPDSLNPQLSALNMPATRLKYAIAQLAPGSNYLRAVMRDKFGTEDLDTLSLEQLTQLRNTLAARKSSRQRKQINTSLQGGAVPSPAPQGTVSTVSPDSTTQPF
jgi:hypothetical protein